jgi:hypothetical protein
MFRLVCGIKYLVKDRKFVWQLHQRDREHSATRSKGEVAHDLGTIELGVAFGHCACAVEPDATLD